jgi:hypothetical protein
MSNYKNVFIMKNFLLLVVLAIVGAAIAVLSGWNEGNIAGAWVGVVYSVFVAAFAALVENQAFEKPWKETVPSIIAVVGGAIIGAIGFSICL